MLRQTPTTSELSRCTEVLEHDSDNGLFKSVRRHELGWLDCADGVADTSTPQDFLEEIQTNPDHDPKGFAFSCS